VSSGTAGTENSEACACVGACGGAASVAAVSGVALTSRGKNATVEKAPARKSTVTTIATGARSGVKRQ